MTNVEKQNYGYKVTFAGSVSPEDMSSWVDKSKETVTNSNSGFGVLIDMREMSPLSPAAKAHLEEGQKIYKAKGMKRSAVIVNQGFIATQLKMVAQQTGIYDWEKYIDASVNNDWENKAVNWLNNGISPE